LFETQTKPLTEYEKEILLPIMVKCLAKHIGKSRAISNAQMCAKMSIYGYQIGETVVRKLINHIRNNGLVERLVASGKGYYVAESIKEMEAYIESVKNREEAIRAMRMSMEEQLLKMKPTENNPDGPPVQPQPC
jgi:glutamyl/glutaminyl-tRNA synthetase